METLLSALSAIPSRASREAVFIVPEGTANPESDTPHHEFCWAVWFDTAENFWGVYEFYPEPSQFAAAGWTLNTGVQSIDRGLAFISAWMEDYAPDLHKKYFPRVIH